MLLQVHDELVFECPARRTRELGKLVKQLMEGVARTRSASARRDRPRRQLARREVSDAAPEAARLPPPEARRASTPAISTSPRRKLAPLPEGREVETAARQALGSRQSSGRRTPATAPPMSARSPNFRRTCSQPSSMSRRLAPVERWAFLDTETRGLSGGSGTFAFLVGVGAITAARLRAQAVLHARSRRRAVPAQRPDPITRALRRDRHLQRQRLRSAAPRNPLPPGPHPRPSPA